MKLQNVSLRCFLFIVIFLSGLLIFLLDQFIKHKIRLSGGFYVCNQGISFGLGMHPLLFWLLTALFIFSFFYLLKYLGKKALSSPYFILASVFIFSGALSNMSDRLFFGCVFDYITLFQKIFPVFNVADISIFTGSCILIFFIYRKDTLFRV